MHTGFACAGDREPARVPENATGTVCAVQQGGVYAEALRSERAAFEKKLEEKSRFRAAGAP